LADQAKKRGFGHAPLYGTIYREKISGARADRPQLAVRMMAVPKNDKYKDYARSAAHCLNMVASTRDPELRCIQREMAARLGSRK
jgi:hypothetical protein